MIRAFRLVALVASAIAASVAHAGSWSPAGPTDGHYTIATHPTVAGVAMIGGGYGSLSTWFSNDAGASWIGNPWRGATERPVLAGVPTVAWMTRSGQLLRSTDTERSWGIVETGSLESIEEFAVNPFDPDEVIVGGMSGTRHTRNGGATWVADPAAGDIYALTVDWSARQLYVVNYGTLDMLPPLRRRSLDAVGPWSTLASAHAVTATRGIVLTTPWDGGLLRSTDGGTTFVPVPTSFPIDASQVVFASEATASSHRVYATYREPAGYRIVRSDDDGATWFALPGPALDTPLAPSLAVDAGNADRLYLVAGHGVVASSNGGASFQPLPRPTGAPAGPQLVEFDPVDPARRWTRGLVDAPVSGIPRTTDGGGTWTEIAPQHELLGASRTRTNTLFGVNVFLGGGGLSLSRDGGDTWSVRASTAFSWFGPMGYGAASGEIYVAGRGFDPITNAELRGVLVSTDDGETFVQHPAPPNHVRAFASTPGPPATVYAAGDANIPGGAQLWRSVDRAASWQPVHAFPHPWIAGVSYGNHLLAIAVDPTDPNRLYAGLALPDHLMRSVDGGATWTRAAVGLGAGAVTWITVDPANPAIVYAAQHGSGVFRSADRGLTWTALDQGLREDATRQVVLDPYAPGWLYAGTDSGLWRANLSTGLPPGRRRAIEFYHAGFDHYFVSADLDEVAGLDAGVFAGWARTGEGFRVAEAGPSGYQPACRFFGTGFAPKSSHFYTPYPVECETVKSDPHWFYEKIAYGLALPDPITRGCPPDTRPLFRAWNRNIGGAPNHRYNTDWGSMERSVLSQGWVLEGEASTFVFACVPIE